MGRFWHSFADMSAIEAGGEFVLDRGDGVHVWDEDGRRYIDATAGLWYCNVGYGRGEIADAAAAQLRRLSAYSTFGEYSGHATVAAVAMANLDILEREALPKRALQLESDLADALSPLAAHPLVQEVRAGTCVLAAVQLSAEAMAEDPTLTVRAIRACRQAGVMTRALATGGLQVSPALVIDQAGLDELREAIRAALDVLVE